MDQRNRRQNKGYNRTSSNHYSCRESGSDNYSPRGTVVDCPDTFSAPVDYMPVGMGYVPWQQWGEVFTGEAGLAHGTIFPELVKPWWVKCGQRM